MYILKEEADKNGVVVQGENFVVVKKEGVKGDNIPKHNHPEANILFTIVKGHIKVTLNDDEVIDLIPGKLLNFDGNNYISAELLEDSQAFVTLILK